MLPFISIPFLLATPIPVKYESGTDIAIAHGHDITKNVSPRCIASSIGILNIIGKQITIRSANIITIGVYILLILETIVSVFVFLSVASSKSSNIFDTVEFSAI